MNTIEDFQRQLLQETRFVFQDAPPTEAAENAFKAAPRHLFVNRYRKFGTKEWQDVTAENLQLHLGRLYADDALCLFGDDDNDPVASISQPSFVLRCFDLLQLQRGQRVFELGAGSGWNAALIAQSLGPDGHVYSVELIPELVEEASKNLRRAGIPNVTVIAGDAGDGYAPGAPYDRATFTAGTFDLPGHFYTQVKQGGLLLIGIKSEGGGDTLFLLRKTADHFESDDSMPCGWVQMRGKYRLDSANPQPVETLEQWGELQDQRIDTTPYWWGIKGKDFFVWATTGLLAFLGITEPSFRTFVHRAPGQPREERYFGLWDPEQQSLVLAKHDCLISYGNSKAKDRLMDRIRQWVDLGMPTGASFGLHVYPVDMRVTTKQRQWLVRRKQSQFLWTLK